MFLTRLWQKIIYCHLRKKEKLPSDPFVVEEGEGFLKPPFYLLECILDQQCYVQTGEKVRNVEKSSSQFLSDRRKFHVGRCRFHHHFMSIFLYKSFLRSFSFITVWLCNIDAKAALKMLVKLTGLIISGLFICDFEYIRLKIWLFFWNLSYNL